METRGTAGISFLIAFLGMVLVGLGGYVCLALSDPLDGLLIILVACLCLAALMYFRRGQRRLRKLEAEIVESSRRSVAEMLRQGTEL